jgi:O-succinylbenzoate synthase
MTDPAPPVELIELRQVALPLVRPFRTSFGEEREKRAVLIRVEGGGVQGWGECVAAPLPRYSEEWLDGAWMILRDVLGPAALSGGDLSDPDELTERLAWVRGNRMSLAALEAAVLDRWLRLAGRSLRGHLGGIRERVPCGVSVGIAPSVEALLREVGAYISAGYRRIKLKIEPGWDLEVVRAARKEFPDVPLSVDANGAYVPSDAPLFEALDELDLVMIEQPLGHEDLLDHARLQSRLRTPICLDESIRSAHDAAAAIELGACRVINIKPGRVGGVSESKAVHDVAVEAGIPVWIGGMLETGVGRGVNLALASLPGVSLPGDTSASDRYFTEDLTDPFVLDSDGTMAVPEGSGIGVEPLPDRLEACTVRIETITGP